jgi:hypothetical protein
MVKLELNYKFTYMIYSKKNNLLYIAVPKTGTTSVERALLKIDPEAENHSLTVGDKMFKGRDLEKGILSHARAKEIKKVVPEDFFNNLNILGTIRDPKSKLVSAYFFSKKDKLIKSKYIKISSFRLLINEVKFIAGVLMARLLPFQIWAFLYPYRSNYDYIFDDKGNRLVPFVARTEYLESDLKLIFSKLDIEISKFELGISNTSNHRHYLKYYENKLFNKLISKRMKKDNDLYNTVGVEINKLGDEFSIAVKKNNGLV